MEHHTPQHSQYSGVGVVVRPTVPQYGYESVSKDFLYDVLINGSLSLLSSVGLTSAVAGKINLPPATRYVTVERAKAFSLSDGTNLAADIFLPKGVTKATTILVRIPFSKSINTNFLENIIGRIWAERGYAAVIQGTRGRFNSGGEYYPMKNERADGVETLSWISKQPWYNGKIYGWGGSASGQTLWAISDQKAPRLNAMEVYFASSNFHDMFYQGNAFSLATALAWTLRSHDKHKDEDDFPNYARLLKAAQTLPFGDSDQADLKRTVDFYQDWIAHKEIDDYWRTIDGVKKNELFDGSALFLLGGSIHFC